MASGHASIHNGAVNGTGSAISVVCGFKPRCVNIFTDEGVLGYWNDQMADASAYKMTEAGAGSLVTSNGITPAVDGFTIGTDGDLNASGQVIYFTAMQ